MQMILGLPGSVRLWRGFFKGSFTPGLTCSTDFMYCT